MKKSIILLALSLSFLKSFSQITEKDFYTSLGCEISVTKNGIAAYEVNRKEGFRIGLVRTDGTILTQPIFDGVTLTDNGYIEVRQNGKWGALDKELKQIIPFKYNAINYKESGAVFEVCVKVPQDDNCKFGTVDMLGKEMIKPVYNSLKFISENLVVAGLNGKYGIINSTGVKILDFTYDELYYVIIDERNPKKRIAAKLNGKWGIVDYSGKVIIAPKYDLLALSREGLHGACLQGKCGYIDDDGNIVIDFKYDADIPYINAKPSFYSFLEGMAKIKLDGFYGFLNRKGELAIPNVLSETKYNHFSKEGNIWADY